MTAHWRALRLDRDGLRQRFGRGARGSPVALHEKYWRHIWRPWRPLALRYALSVQRRCLTLWCVWCAHHWWLWC